MIKNRYKTIGIIGGLGSQATIDMYQEIINCTGALNDQEHLPVLISSIPHTPSRVKAILENEESPVPYIAKAIMDLKVIGAEIIIVACNTAHYFQNEIESDSKTKILSMINETLKSIKIRYPNVHNVGLLATVATIRSKIFEKDSSINILTPLIETQKNKIDKAISLIKSGKTDNYPKTLLIEAIDELKQNGAEAIILGCTELPLIIKSFDINIPLINPTQIVAKKAIEIAKNNIQIKNNIVFKQLFTRFENLVNL